jgi:tetraacyldisaccharide 4'-kinase
MSPDVLRAFVARRLERGAAGSWPERFAARTWEAWSQQAVARPLRLPAGARVIGIGGATLGGAGKSPVAIAIARALAARGDDPALVGHAYRASPRAPRVVGRGDHVSDVGDDALAAARALDGVARVVVAPTRQMAVDHAAFLGHRVIIVDALLQASPHRLSTAVLVVDGVRPWGAGACPPLGDLRAPRSALLGAADLVVAVLGEGETLHATVPAGAVVVTSRVAGAASATDEVVDLGDLRTRRVGLLLAIARPERVVSALARAGIHPEVTMALADHAVPDARALAAAAVAPVDAWLTTARCATKLPAAIGGRPVLALDHRLDVEHVQHVEDLARRIASRASG